MKLLDDHKLDLFLGTLGGFIYGAGTPIAGYFLGETINALSRHEDTEKMRKNGLRWSLYHLGLAIF